jgi:hypothetical protein
MKKFILFVLLALVVVILFFVFKKDLKNDLMGDSVSKEETQEVTKKYTPKNQFNGVKDIDLMKSTFNWQGRKTFVKDWIDSGFVDAKSGFLAFEDGYISGGEIVIDMNSIKAIQTGANSLEDKLTNHLKSEDFFNISKYPTSKILITGFKDNLLQGDLTVNDITKKVTIPVSIFEDDALYTLSGKLEIDRTEFGIKFNSNLIKDLSDEVLIDNIFVVSFKVILK